MLLTIEKFLTGDEVARLLGLAETGVFVDGRGTAGAKLHDVKHNEQLKMSEPEARAIHQVLGPAMERSEAFQTFAWPKRVQPPYLSRYTAGMEYGDHIDAPILGRRDPLRSDLSMTLFLSDPESYDGGELMLETPFGTPSVKPAAGDAVVYSTTLRHRVTPVTRGQQIAIVTWIQSLVKSLEQRQVLYDLAKARTGIMSRLPRSQETELLLQVHTNLLKMWAEV